MPTILPSNKPFARGVTQLMYVGDDEGGSHPLHKIGYANLAAVAVAAGVAIGSKGATRKLAIGAAGLALYNVFWSGIWTV